MRLRPPDSPRRAQERTKPRCHGHFPLNTASSRIIPEVTDEVARYSKARLADRKAGRVLFAGARTLKLRAIYGAPLPHFEGSISEIHLTLARKSRSEDGGACPGEVDTGSPSGHATKKKETWLFDNWIGKDTRQ